MGCRPILPNNSNAVRMMRYGHYCGKRVETSVRLLLVRPRSYAALARRMRRLPISSRRTNAVQVCREAQRFEVGPRVRRVGRALRPQSSLDWRITAPPNQNDQGFVYSVIFRRNGSFARASYADRLRVHRNRDRDLRAGHIKSNYKDSLNAAAKSNL
jgi:hypothetical protein